jgi:hypothetical protein
MSFTLPNFNITFNVWYPANTPNAAAADTATAGQFYIWSKGGFGKVDTGFTRGFPNLFIRIPIGFVKAIEGAGQTLVNAIFGTADPIVVNSYYRCIFWDTIHKGFPNEYGVCQVEQCDGAGTSPDPRR